MAYPYDDEESVDPGFERKKPVSAASLAAAVRSRRETLNPAKPENYPQSRATQRKLYGPRAIVSRGPAENPRNDTSTPANAATFQLGAATQQRQSPTQSGGVANPPPIHYNDEPSAPRAVGTPTRLLGPNVRKGETNPVKIARALEENKAAMRPGGMGTASATQDAQSSEAAKGRMNPTNFNMRGAVSADAQKKIDAAKEKVLAKSSGGVAGIEMPEAEGKRTWQDATGNTRTAVPINPEYQKHLKTAQEGTGVIKPGGPNQWRRDLLAEHPEIGKPGTPENTEFVKEFTHPSVNMDPGKAMSIANAQRAARLSAGAPPAAAQIRGDITPKQELQAQTPAPAGATRVRSDVTTAGPAANIPPVQPARNLQESVAARTKDILTGAGNAVKSAGASVAAPWKPVADVTGGIMSGVREAFGGESDEEKKKRLNPVAM